jgi:hypothetical protein
MVESSIQGYLAAPAATKGVPLCGPANDVLTMEIAIIEIAG